MKYAWLSVALLMGINGCKSSSNGAGADLEDSRTTRSTSRYVMQCGDLMRNRGWQKIKITYEVGIAQDGTMSFRSFDQNENLIKNIDKLSPKEVSYRAAGPEGAARIVGNITKDGQNFTFDFTCNRQTSYGNTLTHNGTSASKVGGDNCVCSWDSPDPNPN